MAVITAFEPYVTQSSSVVPVTGITLNNLTTANTIFAALTQSSEVVPVTPIKPIEQINFRSQNFLGGSARVTQGLTITDATNTINLGADATIEMWLRVDSLPVSGTLIPIIAKRDNTSTSPPNWLFLYCDSNGYLTLQVSSDSVGGAWGLNITGTKGISPGTWNHIAVVRQSTTTWTVYVNGAFYLSGTVSGALNNLTTTLVIGAADSTRVVVGSFGLLQGYIDGLRINTTTAVYTSAFTPTVTLAPTATQAVNVYGSPSAAISSGTVLLVDPTFGSTFTDLTGTSRTFTGATTNWLTPFEGSVSSSGVVNETIAASRTIPVTNLYPFTQTISTGTGTGTTEMWI